MLQIIILSKYLNSFLSFFLKMIEYFINFNFCKHQAIYQNLYSLSYNILFFSNYNFLHYKRVNQISLILLNSYNYYKYVKYLLKLEFSQICVLNKIIINHSYKVYLFYLLELSMHNLPNLLNYLLYPFFLSNLLFIT